MPTPYSRLGWLISTALAVALLGAAALLGHWLGQPAFLIALTALTLLGWQFRQRQRILDHLLSRRRWQADDSHGTWSHLRQLLYRQQQRAHTRQHRLLHMLHSYRAVADALPDALVVVERLTQRIHWFNPAATHLLGLTTPGDLGAPLVSRLASLPLAHWLVKGRHAEPILDAPSPHDPALRLHLRLVPWSDEQWLLIARDVSKLLHLEQVRRDFVANVSHELRTPLTVLHGYLELLDADDLHEPSPDIPLMLTEMRQQSTRMRQLLDDLLTLSRLESPSQLEPEPIAMPALLASLQREAEALSQGQHQIDIEDSAMVDLLGAGQELHSAFSNLISNAVRYTPAGGRILLSFSGNSEGAIFAVHDTGPGIPAEHLPRLTERFYRISRSRSRDSGGTGLGLAIVKHILSLHRARLEITSQIGQGSTFACCFGREHVTSRLL